jgi:hypothetical protein
VSSARGYVARAAARSPFAGIEFPRSAVPVATALVLILGARAQEMVPRIAVLLHPLILALVIGAVVLGPQINMPAVRSAFSDVGLRLIAAYFLWAGITAPFGLWSGLAMSAALRLVFTFIPMVTILLCRPTLENVRRVRFGVVASIGATAVLFAFLAIESSPGRYGTPGSYDSNDSAALFALAVPLTLYCAMYERGRRRLVAMLVAPFILMAIVRTGSRGGVIAVVVGTLVYSMFQPGRRRLGMLGFMVLAGALSWTFGTPAFRERIGGLVRGEEDYNTSSRYGRQEIWKRGITYTLQNPITGVGMGNFTVAEGEHNKALGIDGRWMAPHNAYVQAFAELGFLGGILLVTLIGVSLVRGFRIARARAPAPMPDLAASLTAFAISAFFLSHAYFFMGFALVALIGLATRATANARATAHASPAVRAGRPPAGPPLVAG